MNMQSINVSALNVFLLIRARIGIHRLFSIARLLEDTKIALGGLSIFYKTPHFLYGKKTFC